MTVELFAKWLLDNFPHDAQLVTTNSLAWFNTDVERVKAEELPNYFYLKKNPTKKGEPIKPMKDCLVIHDDMHYNY